jgi:hypothetical protein
MKEITQRWFFFWMSWSNSANSVRLMVFSVSDRVFPSEKESNAKIIVAKHIIFNVMIISFLIIRG